MPSNRKLPDIAPCPRTKCTQLAKVKRPTGYRGYYVVCGCGWAGPSFCDTPLEAIEEWNAAWNRRSDEAAERRGAMAAVRWLRENESLEYAARVQMAIDAGEVIPKAQKRGRK